MRRLLSGLLAAAYSGGGWGVTANTALARWPSQGCSTPTPLGSRGQPVNVARVSTRAGEVWALALGPFPPRVGQEVKIVWRVAGSGPLNVSFRDPNGNTRPLTFGPEAHMGSTFVHPGDEWG